MPWFHGGTQDREVKGWALKHDEEAIEITTELWEIREEGSEIKKLQEDDSLPIRLDPRAAILYYE